MFVIIGLCLCSFAFSQSLKKAYFENNPHLGGDVTITSSKLDVMDEEIYITFEIESPVEDVFYMDAWILIPGNLPEYKVAINGLLSEHSFKPQTDSWQSLALTDAKKSAAVVKLKKGKNSVSIIEKKPMAPMVEFIKLSLNPLNTGISDKNYKEFIENIKSNSLIDVKYGDSIKMDTRSGSFNPTGGFNPVTTRGTAGEIYDFLINMPVYYTTMFKYQWNNGQVVNITTASQSGNFEHVIEVFQDNSPISYSWSTLSTLSGNGNMNITISHSDWYVVRIRSFRQFTSGIVNVTVNGQLRSNCPVTSSGMALTNSSGSNLKYYFTCNVKNGGDTWLFLEDNSSAPGKIKVFNNDGGTKSDGYSWGTASLASSSNSIKAGLVSLDNSNLPSTECDLYLNLSETPSSVLLGFPTLAVDNSFVSGPASAGYNSIAWAAGQTTNKYLSTLSDVDAYYLGYGYTRTYASGSNSAIAVWAQSNGMITHASVRKNTTHPNPHGFEWESKCGQQERIMHWLYGLTGIVYGSVTHFYRPVSGTVNYSLEVDESDNISTRSQTVHQDIFTPSDWNKESYFTQSDLNQIAVLKDRIPANIISDFENKYLTWIKTWSRPEIAIHSNPRKYAESDEYENLLNYSVKYGKTFLPLIFEKINQGEVLVMNLLQDLTFHESKQLYDDIISYLYSKVEVGKPLPSDKSIWTDYSKKLLEKDYDNILKSIQDIPALEEEVIDVNTFATTNGQDILLTIYSDDVAKANVKIYSLFGKLEYEANYDVQKGEQTVAIDTSTLQKGIYVIQITVGGKKSSQKISI